MADASSNKNTEPRASRPHMAGYGVPHALEGVLPWEWARRRLSESHNYWFTTARPGPWPDNASNIIPDILSTKLFVPRARSPIVDRSRLLTQPEDGPPSAIILLSAPAGYGKTTLVPDWLCSRTPDAVAHPGQTI